MSRNVPVRAEPYALKNKLRRIWRQFVRVMACIVVFCTTYAMILPAITMQRKTVCGVTEHTHGILCYVQLTSKTVQELTCTYESLGVHVHTAECLDDMGAPVCGYADWLVHTHDDRCGDTCTLPEISEHTHSETCYNTHAHDEACDTAVPGGLLCEIHVHGDGCYDPGEPVCGLTEDAHTHADACYAPTLTCAAAEHTHGDGCYDNGDPICGVTEEGHVHESGCYAPTLTCGEAEHTHADGCYDNGEPICGQTEDVHVHGDACYAP
ncbi:MAG: hypothetical protein IJZ13_03310, partial [Clostridia bacterium]|nr:hypothetical protein [Clostridia bacterium]